MTTYVTADPHFGHEKIIKICNRPFKSANHMDLQLVKNFNDVVKPNDDLYIIGDVSLRSKQYRHYYKQIFSKLNGRIHVIGGNHDVDDFRFYVECGATSFHYPYFELDDFVLCHDPALSVLDRKKWFIVGHVHDLFLQQKNCINVCVEMFDYKPVSLDSIKTMVYSLEMCGSD